MQLATAGLVVFSTGNTTDSVFKTLLELAVVVVSFIAMAKIISKAGYSAWWVMVPIGTIALWFILAASVFNSSSLGDVFSNLSTLTTIVELSLLANWILYLVFAFSNWPVLDRPSSRKTRLVPHQPPPVVLPYLAPTPAPPVEPAGGAAVFEEPSAADPQIEGGDALPPVVVATAPPPPTTVFCAWCGQERAIDAHAIHHCGSKERPMIYCTTCGETLDDGAESCGSCGAPVVRAKRR